VEWPRTSPDLELGELEWQRTLPAFQLGELEWPRTSVEFRRTTSRSDLR
jgi:hypothetical protein